MLSVCWFGPEIGSMLHSLFSLFYSWVNFNVKYIDSFWTVFNTTVVSIYIFWTPSSSKLASLLWMCAAHKLTISFSINFSLRNFQMVFSLFLCVLFISFSRSGIGFDETSRVTNKQTKSCMFVCAKDLYRQSYLFLQRDIRVPSFYLNRFCISSTKSWNPFWHLLVIRNSPIPTPLVSWKELEVSIWDRIKLGNLFWYQNWIEKKKKNWQKCILIFYSSATLSSKSRRTKSCLYSPHPVATRFWFRSIADLRWLIFFLSFCAVVVIGFWPSPFEWQATTINAQSLTVGHMLRSLIKPPGVVYDHWIALRDMK